MDHSVKRRGPWNKWPELDLAGAVEQARLTVTVCDARPPKKVTLRFDNVDQYKAAVNSLTALHVVTDGGEDEVVARPVEFTLALMKERDLGPEGFTIDNVLRVCLGYVAQAIEATGQDREVFYRRIADAASKRRGADLPGRAGY